MAELQIEDAPKKLKELTNKAFASFERKNYDYVIDILSQVIREEPRLLQARKYLRAAEIQRSRQKGTGFLSKTFSSAKSIPKVMKIQSLIKSGNGIEAINMIEELFESDPLDMSYIKLFAEASVVADLPEAAVMTLEYARELNPQNIDVLSLLSNLYLRLGRTSSSRECCEKICELKPNDPDALKALKDVLALHSMNEGNWERAKSSRDIIKNKDEAKALEVEKKAVKTEEDSILLIEETLKKIEKEPGNINYYRELSRHYLSVNDYEHGVGALQKAQEMSPGDAEIDNAISSAYSQYYDYQIEQLKASGNMTEAEQKLSEKAQYLFEDLQEKVQRYPNDLKLKYEWGIMLYNNDYFNEAIQQFQASQRNPKYRISSLFYLAMCFKAKKQLDLASEQLDKASSEIYLMDDTKKDIIYELGLICEMLNNKDKALNYYKQIYAVDIGYKDIAAKVENVYHR